MFKSICDVMKKMLGLTLGLFILGGILEVLALTWSLESILPAVFLYLGFASIALALITGVSALGSMLIPGIKHQLDLCQSNR